MKGIHSHSLPVLTALLALLGAATAGAITKTSVSAGNWTTITWNPAGQPGTGDDVVIATDVTLNTTPTTVLSLTVNSGSTFTMSSGITPRTLNLTGSGGLLNGGTIKPGTTGGAVTNTLNVNGTGNFVNNGTFTTAAASTYVSFINVSLGGSAAQSIDGTTATAFTNLTIANIAAPVSAANNFSILPGATMTVNSNATFNTGTYVVSGAGTFTLATGATLGIGSTAGIAASGAIGNIQTSTRNLVSGANYTYNGTANQSIGTGLPADLTGTLTINNPGNMVTLDNAGTITLNMLNLTGGVFSNATVIRATNFVVGAAGGIGGSTTIDLPAGETLDVPAVSGGFRLSGTQTLQRSGGIRGAFIQDPGATLSPGGNSLSGTLAYSNSLTLSGGGNLVFDLSNNPSQVGGTNDLITVAGNLTLAGTNDVMINPLNCDLATGVYRLFNYSGSLLNGDGTYFTMNINPPQPVSP
jgi:hypothetical protein